MTTPWSVPDSEQPLTGEEIAAVLEASGSQELAALIRAKIAKAQEGGA